MSLQIQGAKYGTSQHNAGLLGSIVGGIGGFITGGPGGAIAGAVAGWKGGGSKPSGPTAVQPSMPVVPTPGIGGAVARVLPGGKTGYEVSPRATAVLRRE